MSMKYSTVSVALALFACGNLHAVTYYVDSSSPNTVQDGLTPQTAWVTLTQVNAPVFQPSDSILFRRGTSYSGLLWPQGSGTQGSPITIGGYGAGTRPSIDAAGEFSVIFLWNQEHYRIQGLELTGGSQFGVLITGDVTNGSLTGFHLNDLVVHNCWGDPRWDSGLIVITPYATGLLFHDVLVENSHAHSTNLWYGIHVGFNFFSGAQVSTNRSTNVTVRGCWVNEVYGDLITVSQANGVLIEGNTVWRGGLAPRGISYTPNAIWVWSCDNSLIHYNEASQMFCFEPWDGGGFGVDWGNTNTLVEYNYAHDCQGFGAAIYGRFDVGTLNTVIRYNTFWNNGQDEIVQESDNGGWIEGVEIYGNVIGRD